MLLDVLHYTISQSSWSCSLPCSEIWPHLRNALQHPQPYPGARHRGNEHWIGKVSRTGSPLKGLEERVHRSNTFHINVDIHLSAIYITTYQTCSACADPSFVIYNQKPNATNLFQPEDQHVCRIKCIHTRTHSSIMVHEHVSARV